MLIVHVPKTRNPPSHSGRPQQQFLKIVNGRIVSRFRYVGQPDVAALTAWLNDRPAPRSNVSTLPDYLL